jgi:metal-sulfur cluster biosynthetic enzyme
MSTTIDDVTEAMKDVIDPELGINVIDLGLVYDMRLDENNIATLDMTLTSAACPLQDVIEDQTRQVSFGYNFRCENQLGMAATLGSK